MTRRSMLPTQLKQAFWFDGGSYYVAGATVNEAYEVGRWVEKYNADAFVRTRTKRHIDVTFFQFLPFGVDTADMIALLWEDSFARTIQMDFEHRNGFAQELLF